MPGGGGGGGGGLLGGGGMPTRSSSMSMSSGPWGTASSGLGGGSQMPSPMGMGGMGVPMPGGRAAAMGGQASGGQFGMGPPSRFADMMMGRAGMGMMPPNDALRASGRVRGGPMSSAQGQPMSGRQMNPNFQMETGTPGIGGPRQNAPSMNMVMAQLFNRFRG